HEKKLNPTRGRTLNGEGPEGAANQPVFASKLSQLFDGTGLQVPTEFAGTEVRQIAVDSRKVQPRALFFALHGAKADGNAFIADAVKRGAIAVASEAAAPPSLSDGVAWIPIHEPRKTLSIVAANFYQHPANALQLVAVTGTNGKTTTTSLIDSI